MGKFVLKDPYYKKAKREGYRARSAYKLKDIQDRFHLIKKGDKVLDLGCAPGSFLQVIAGLVGTDGLAAGIDILPMDKLPAQNVVTFQEDIRATDAEGLLARLAIPCFDVVTCDIAPNLSGIPEVDERNIGEIYGAVRGVLDRGLKKGGSFVLKSFFSASFKATLEDLRKIFKKVTVHKPPASRSVSSEVYLICTGRI